jgi:integrase
MPARYAAAVWLAAWSGLRYGELFALARKHVDTETRTVRVERALINVPGQPLHFGQPKTRKSVRTVRIPSTVARLLAEHLDEHVPLEPDALVFALPDGRPVANVRVSAWFRKARAVIGREDLTWHDLRHTGAMFAYRAGASVPTVQARLGHTTMRAAMIYAHAADDSDAVLADALEEYASAAMGASHLRAV